MSNYNKTFYWLSCFFCLFFFLIPLFVLYRSDGVAFAGRIYSLTDEEFNFILFSFLLFIVGFISFDLTKLIFPTAVVMNVQSNEVEIQQKLTPLFFVLLSIYVLFVSYQVIFSNIAESHYAIRKGDKDSDLFSFFISNVMNAIRLLLILSLLALKKNKSAILLVIFVIVTLIIQSTGRLSLLLHISLLILIMSSIRPYRLAMLTTPAVIILMPLLVYLKEIIYMLSMGQGISLDLLTLPEIESSIFIKNFGHILISYIKVEELVEFIGFSYGWDYIQGFLFYLKLIGLDFGLSITYFNTYNILGVKKSIIPPGYLTFGYIQFGLLGVFLAGFTYRSIGMMGSLFLGKMSKGNYVSNASLFYIAFICANSFYHGDFRIFVMSLFFPVIFCLIFNKLVIKNAN